MRFWNTVHESVQHFKMRYPMPLPTPTTAAEELCQQEVASAIIEQSSSGEESCKNRSQATRKRRVQTMRLTGRLFQHVVDKVDCKYHYHDDANGNWHDPKGDTRSHPAVMPTSPANTPFSGDKGRFSIFHPACRQCEETSCACCQVGGQNTWEMVVWSVPCRRCQLENPGWTQTSRTKDKHARQASVKLWPGIALTCLPHLPIRVLERQRLPGQSIRLRSEPP